MKSLKLSVLLFLLLLTQLVSAVIVHDLDNKNWIYAPYLDFYFDNFLGTKAVGRGYSGVADFGSIESTLLNPASMQIESKTDFYYEFGTKNNIKYWENTELTPHKNGYMFGGVIKIGDQLQAGVIYGIKSNVNYDIRKESIEYGHNAGIYQIYFNKSCSIVNIPISYQLNENLSLGASLNFELYKSLQSQVLPTYYGLKYFEAKADFNLVRVSLGSIYKLNNFSFGASFLTQTEKIITERMDDYKLTYEPNEFPWELRAGLTYKLSHIPLNFLADLNYSNTSVYEEYKNKIDFNLGSEYTFRSLVLRLGYFSQLDFRDLDFKDIAGEDYWENTVNQERHFATMGASFAWKALEFSAAYITSELLSPDTKTLSNLKFAVSLTPPELKDRHLERRKARRRRL